MRHTRRSAWIVRALVLLWISACTSGDSDGDTLTISATGTLQGAVYLDVDGSGDQSGADQPFSGLHVQAVTGGGGVVAEGVTDDEGLYQMLAVPVGSYRIRVDPLTLPESIEVFDLVPTLFRLRATETVSRSFRVSYRTYSLAEVAALPPGIQVITHGYALNSRGNFGDGVVHFQDGATYLRGTNVERNGGLAPGDSVRIVGWTSRDLGLPILDAVQTYRLIAESIFLEPVPLSTAEAASARDGVLDAGLVTLDDAKITAVVPAGGGLLVTADDGSGPVDFFLRDFLGFNPANYLPDTTQFAKATGLLVPYDAGGGEIRWRITPRGTADLTVVPFP